MIPRETIRHILETAVYAPSGDNAQPWRFVCGQSTIFIYNLPDRDQTLYNFRQRGSYLGHGALIENIIIASAEAGFEASTMYFPGPALCVARIDLKPAATKGHPLFEAIRLRTSNRKPYSRQPLGPRDLTSIQEAVGHSSASLVLAQDRESIRSLAIAVATNERVLMENRQLHDFLFSMIRWSKRAEERSPGLYIKTMEFPPPVRILLKYVISHWFALKMLNMIGFSRSIAKQSGQLYDSSAAIGALIIENDADHAYIDAGRALQRIWLTATTLGISMQPITAIPYLRDRIEEGESEMFSKEHRTMIRTAYATIARIYGIRREELHIAMIFRIGRGPRPSAASHKLPPVIEFNDSL
jgi:nitroreductase